MLRVGWLGSELAYTRGEVPLEFLERLFFALERCSFDLVRSTYQCPLCPDPWPNIEDRFTVPEPQYYAERALSSGTRYVSLGSRRILVPSKRGTTYLAPDLIYHYIEVHGYRPPDQFIDAIMDFDPELEFDPEERFREAWKDAVARN